jgi:glycosyltransferase EpsE
MICCDDGSTDGTLTVLRSYAERFPDKFVILTNDKNRKLPYSLNHCLSVVETDLVARMDGDDISLSTRFEKEAKFLEENPDYSIVSCPMIYFDEYGDWGKGTSVEYPDKFTFVAGTPFCHAPCMVRAEAYKAADGYSEDVRTLRAEDYDLWFRLYSMGYKGYNLQEPLYKMRDDEDAYNRRKFKYARNEAYVRRKGYKILGLPLKYRVYSMRPIIVGLLPKPLYMKLHKKRK